MAGFSTFVFIDLLISSSFYHKFKVLFRCFLSLFRQLDYSSSVFDYSANRPHENITDVFIKSNSDKLKYSSSKIIELFYFLQRVFF